MCTTLLCSGWMIADPICSMFIAILIIMRYIYCIFMHFLCIICMTIVILPALCLLWICVYTRDLYEWFIEVFSIQYNPSDEGVAGNSDAEESEFS